MSDDDRVRAHVFVSGKVQGVYFRATTRDTAREHGVDGWVRNLADGRVEAVFEGPEGAVDELVAFCHEGSPAASVERDCLVRRSLAFLAEPAERFVPRLALFSLCSVIGGNANVPTVLTGRRRNIPQREGDHGTTTSRTRHSGW